MCNKNNGIKLRRAQNFKCPSLFVLGYHWLPIATTDLVGSESHFTRILFT